MANVHGYVYYLWKCCMQRLHDAGFPNNPFQYTYGVGFGIAYPQQEGNARALNAG